VEKDKGGTLDYVYGPKRISRQHKGFYGTNKVPLKLDQDQGTLTLHVFLDKSVMEVFADGGTAAVTRVIYPGKNLGVAVFSVVGRATVLALDIWRMKPIW